MTLLLSIDVGTTSVKAAVYNAEGRCLALSHQDYQLSTPAVDRVEMDAEAYWTAATTAVKEVIKADGVSPQEIAGIGVSSQGETTIAVDRSGVPLYPALVWLDKRAKIEAQRLQGELGAALYAHTGIPEVNPAWTACKIAWIKHHQPAIYERAFKFLLVQDFIVHRLTGQFVTEGSISCTTMLYDIVTHRWWPESLSAVGLDSGKLAEISQPGEIGGTLLPRAAEILGLPSGIPVVLGGMDQAVGAIGAGNITPEMVSETTGGALAIQVTLSEPDLDPTGQVPVYLHSVPDKYLFVPVCETGGMALQWFRDVFCTEEVEQAQKEGKSTYELITGQAEGIQPGAEGLIMLPHLVGAFSPEYNPQARGTFVGFTLYHRKPHFARAVLEAVAFMLRRNLDLIRKSGIVIKEMRSTGGGAASRLWRQIKSDVCQLPVVTLVDHDTALLGDAVLTAAAIGLYKSPEQAVTTMVSVAEKLLPAADNAEIYELAYQRYCQLNDLLDPYFRSQGGAG
jgi:sugar (pentulose or hexulose) kinase